MENMNFVVNVQSKADKNFENIKESIKGLYQILKISCDNETFCKMGLDNLEALYKNLLELLLNDYGARQLMKKLKNSDEEFLTIDLEQ
ncbi:MAG: hypothetical protein ACFFA6_15325 [Promethearchaeota archaeon]